MRPEPDVRMLAKVFLCMAIEDVEAQDEEDPAA
jgi:hypothetical protein